MFAKLLAIYRGKWAADFEAPELLDLAKAEWSAGLAGFTGEEIKRGLAYCRDRLIWPPSIAEFREACRPTGAPCHRRFVRLPPPIPDSDRARAELAKMRGVL